MTVPKLAKSSKSLFLSQFLQHPRMVGSVIPTSQTAIRALLDPIDWPSVRCVVEYGPGTGVFTRRILERLGLQARLIAIDTNPQFIDYLRQTITDERLICVQGSAAQVEGALRDHGFNHAEVIISGLPFSTLPPSVADDIAAATARAVAPGGQFLVYQYSLFVLPMLQKHFGRIDMRRVWRCIPPARLFWAHKDSAATNALSDDESLAAE